MPQSRKNTLIMGAAGRDFHNFNVHYRKNPAYNVVAFTAAQIPGIANRSYPAKLSGRLYPKGIPIFPESRLAELIKKFHVKEVVFAYSDVSHLEVMHKASLCLSCRASFTLLGPEETALESKKPVIAVCAVRTGSGKSQTTRKIAELLKNAGKKVAIVRHPMPYGNLEKQVCQKFASFKDLKKQNCTIEEREEYEPLVKEGFTVFAGVDYEKILAKAAREADVIIFDGGNNDLPFFKTTLHITVLDPLRQGHETSYHPGEANLRMADVLLINKMNSASFKAVQRLVESARLANPKAIILKANSELHSEGIEKIRGKRVIAVEDGPSVTHGGLPFGVATLMAKRQKAKLVSVERNASGSLRQTFQKFKHLHNVLPAMGYSKQQLRELQQAINSTKADFVISGTPIDLRRILRINKPIIHVSYELKELGKPNLKAVLKGFGLLK